MSLLVLADTALRETVSKEWMKAAGTVGAAGVIIAGAILNQDLLAS